MGPTTRIRLALLVEKYNMPRVDGSVLEEKNQTRDSIPTPVMNKNPSKSYRRATIELSVALLAD